MRTSIKLLAVVFASLGVACAWAAKTGGSYSYVDPFSPRDTYVIDLSESSIVEGDLKFTLSACRPDEQFVCFRSKALSFAVPKAADRSEWTFEGRKYTAGSARTLSLLGRTISGSAISTVEGEIKTTFIYSVDDGLIAISFSDGSKTKNYFLSEKRGFGSK